jgi:uncharacterized protein YbjT (DUF2867 family)
MKVILFGATGMIGQGALRECLLDPEVEGVLVVGRSSTGVAHHKLREILHRDLYDLSAIESELSGYDACLFCLGQSSAGMSEADYRRVTYELTLVVARALLAHNRDLTFVFVSGLGTDSSERGSTMWARVKGETENALLKLPFRAAYMFRPGFIQPLHGVRSKTQAYRLFYVVLGPLFPILKALLPKYVTTSERVARAMLRVAKEGALKPVLETRDIDELGA